MKVYFVRHGQTNYNVLRLCNDDPTQDVHLTELGKKQAKEVNEKLKNIKFDLVITSELPRTQETASIITGNQEFKVEPRLNDIKTGFDSKPVSEWLSAINNDRFNSKVNGGESFQEEKKRISSFLEELKDYNLDNILVVAHEDTLTAINGYYNNLSDEEMWKTKIHNCEILEFDI